MIFCKIAGGVILMLSALALANHKNKRAEAGISQIDGFLAFFKFMRSQIECFGLPATEILSRCDKDIFGFCKYQGESAPQSIEEFVFSCNIENTYCIELMKKFSLDFGKGNKESELLLIDRYASQLTEEKERQAMALPSQKKLNTTLLFAGAAALIILLI